MLNFIKKRFKSTSEDTLDFMSDSTEPKNYSITDPDVQRIVHLARCLNDPEKLAKKDIVEAILTVPAGRNAFLSFCKYTDKEIQPGVPMHSDDLIAPTKTLDVTADCENSSDDLSDFKWSEPLDEFVRSVYTDTSESLWVRQQPFSSYKELLERVKDAEEAAKHRVPAQAEAIEHLADIIVESQSRMLQTDDHRSAGPIFLFTQPGNGATTILQTMAKAMGLRFMAVSDDLTSSSDFFTTVSGSPPVLVELSGMLEAETRGVSQHMLSYFARAVVPFETEPSYFASLSTSVDPESMRGRFRKMIVIFRLDMPQLGTDRNIQRAEDLVALLQTQHQERVYTLNDIPNDYWELIRRHNTVIVQATSGRMMLDRLMNDMTDSMKYISNHEKDIVLRIDNPRQIAAMLLLSDTQPTMKHLDGLAHRFILKCVDKIHSFEDENPSGTTWTVVVERNGAQLPAVFHHDTVTDAVWYRQLETQIRTQKYGGYRLNWTMEIDASTHQIRLTHLEMEAPRAVANGRFLLPRPAVRFQDVIGHERAKERLKLIRDYFIDPDPFHRLEVVPPLRVLLCGEPGTGKTMLAEAFAGEADLPFFGVSAAEVTSQKYAGHGSKLLREVFAAAQTYRPSIIFLDEIDTFGCRESMGSGEVAFDARNIINTLLTLLDGLQKIDDIIVIGATNRLQDLDPALLRPGRFGTQIHVEPLSSLARESLVRKHLSQEVWQDDHDAAVRYVVDRTTGSVSPAEIIEMINEAKITAVIQGKTQLDREILSSTMDRILLGQKLKSLTPELKHAAAVHEAGHALMCRVLLPNLRIDRISIGMRKDSLGMVRLADDEHADMAMIQRDDWISRIKVLLAGPLAEKMVLGHWNMGCGNDFSTATAMAEFAVGDLGIGLGMKGIVMSRVTESGETQGEVREQVLKLIETCSDQTMQLLEHHRSQHEKLAAALEDREDLDQEEIDEIVRSAEC